MTLVVLAVFSRTLYATAGFTYLNRMPSVLISHGRSAGFAVVLPSSFFEIVKMFSRRGGGRAAGGAREQSTVRSDPLEEDPKPKTKSEIYLAHSLIESSNWSNEVF